MSRTNLRTLGSVIALAALAFATSARAEGNRCLSGSYVPADGRLAVKAPNVTIRSYNGRVFIQRAIEPARSRDPMAVRNHATGQVQTWRQSGRLLPSARAWIQEENLYASRPVVDRQTIGKGRAALKQARRAEHTVLALQKYVQTATQFIQTETQKLNAGAYNADPAQKAKVQKAVAKAQSGINKVNQVLSSGPVKKNGQRGPTLQAFAQSKKAEGQRMVEAGRVLRSVLVSVGGVPIDAPLALSNPRHQGDRLPMATASATADKAGYLMAEIGGVREDTIRGEVTFAADANKVGSRVRFEYRIPDGRQNPDLLIDGVRFYKVRPTSVQRVNDQPDAQ